MKTMASGEAYGPALRRGVRVSRFAAPLVAALLTTGCATTQIAAEWTDPQWPKQSLAGTTVLVVCDAQDTTLRLLCESRFSARLAALGARPVAPPADTQPGAQPASPATLAAARQAGAKAILHTTLRPDYSAVSSGPTFSFGIGGFGGSGGGVGGGVGVAMPVGGSTAAGMAASSTLVDAAGAGQVIWSARATAPATSDAAAQIDELAGVLAGGLGRAGFF